MKILEQPGYLTRIIVVGLDPDDGDLSILL